MSKHLFLICLLVGLAFGCGKKGPAQGEEITLPELNRALQVWVTSKGSMPQDLNELTNFPALFGRRLPTPPPGKKLAVDPATRQIVFADE